MALDKDKYGCYKCPLTQCTSISPAHIPPCAKLPDKNFNNLQQLRAEISALMHEIEDDVSGRGTNVKYSYIIERLRQLSAI